jgi:MFS family permease
MKNENYIEYPYRWVIIFIFMLVMAMQQLLWITFAPITSSAAAYYKVSDISIGLFSMIFMVVYIFVSLPASWLIDTRGFRFAVGLGAVFTGVFGLLRGVFAANYLLVLIFQAGIAVGQPLIVNAVTKVAARWFPIEERATASGLAWLAGYLGLIGGLVVTPYLMMSLGMQKMLLWYGGISIIAALGFLFLAREFPPTPQCSPEQEERSLVFDGLKQIMVNRDFIRMMLIFFIGLGVFNGLSTWIEEIIRPRGFSSVQAGIVGGIMIASGIIGSGIVPMLSDKYRDRKHFIILAIAGAIPGLIGITFARSFWLLLLSAGILGFFMLSTAPIGFQYGAEIAYPAPEGTSTGMLMMAGQVSGIIFIFGMDWLKSPKTGSMGVSMIILIALMMVNALICTRLRESALMQR